MKLTLRVGGVLHPVPLTEEGVTIGRGDQATITIQANVVSRIHARVFLKDGKPFVMDMKSLSGSSLIGKLLSKPAALHPGDKVQLSAFSLKNIEQEVRPFEVLWTHDTPTAVQGLR